PVVFLLIGSLYLVRGKHYWLLALSGIYLVGVILIAGDNTIFGSLISDLKESIPLLKQVLRWQSSKLWPLTLIPLALIAPIGVWLGYNFTKQLARGDSRVDRLLVKPVMYFAFAAIGVLSLYYVGSPM